LILKLFFIKNSIADTKICKEFFKISNPDIVVHAAASYKDQTDWQKDISVNVLGAANVVKNSLEHKIKRLIYFQTSLCYGNHTWHEVSSGRYRGDSEGVSSRCGLRVGSFSLSGSLLS
jgi:UDP-glucose 4-epimerase